HPRVDMILMDMMMPEMDGYEATMALRSEEKHRDLPIIAVTALAMTGDKEKCIASGANDYISKPIDDVKLFALINKYI
ncbi:MAG: response regulator, partial [Bacteroidia bacterium]